MCECVWLHEYDGFWIIVEFEAIRTAANLAEALSRVLGQTCSTALSIPLTPWNVNLHWSTYGGVFRAGCYDVFKEGIPLDVQHFSLMATYFRVVRIHPARLKRWEKQISIYSSGSAGNNSKIMPARWHYSLNIQGTYRTVGEAENW